MPTEKSAEIALRTQQILGFESGAADTADPLAGSVYIEHLTGELEKSVAAMMDQIEKMGGSVSCVDSGYFRQEIARSAYAYQRAIEHDEAIVVGVNRFKTERAEIPGILKVDPDLEARQVKQLKEVKSRRDQDRVCSSLEVLRKAAGGSDNIVQPVIEAVENYTTVGEISDVFREVWGEYHEKNA